MFDFCLECWVCKVECFVGVDMVCFKVEFLVGYYGCCGILFWVCVLGYIYDLLVVVSVVVCLINLWLNKFWVWVFNECLFGIDCWCALFVWIICFLVICWGDWLLVIMFLLVVLFNDIFMNYYYFEVGLVVVLFCDRVGFVVEFVFDVCCGWLFIF